MPIKIKSRIKEVMAQKGMGVKEVSDATGLPHVAVLNACSERIEFCGLNILNKIATALDVTIKDLFEEVPPIKTFAQAPRKKTQSGETSISAVTEQLLTTITKLSATDKDRLLEKLNELKKTPGKILDTTNATKELIELIMGMSLDERCHLLGEFMSWGGQTKRKYTRKAFFRPVPFTLNGRLYHGNTKNISMGGVFIEFKDAKTQFSMGDAIKMNIEHPETFQHFNVNGKIVRIGKEGFGVKFDETI